MRLGIEEAYGFSVPRIQLWALRVFGILGFRVREFSVKGFRGRDSSYDLLSKLWAFSACFVQNFSGVGPTDRGDIHESRNSEYTFSHT